MQNTDFIKEMEALDYGKLKQMRKAEKLDREMRFTQTYINHADDPPYIREAHCLKTQFDDILMPIQNGDYFAGRLNRMFVGLDPERGDLNEAAYFCQFDLLREQLEDDFVLDSVKKDAQYLLDFWNKESTYKKIRAVFPEDVSNCMPSDDYYQNLQISFPMFGLGGPCIDYEKLLKKGIYGLCNEVLERKEKAIEENIKDLSFLEGMLMALNIFTNNANRFSEEASRKAQFCLDPENKKRYEDIATSLLHIAQKPPETLHQGIQLVWFYNLHSLTKNYGRMDLYLGNLLVQDIENERLTEAEALDMIVGLYRLIVARGDNFNNRIIVGGKGRPNEANADRFAMLALEAQKIVNEAIPQLSVRWYEGMNPEIWDKSFEVLATGSTMPIIYNDDANIPGIKIAMDVTDEEAEQYAFYGCGEFLIDHVAVASPDAAFNALKTLDVTLRNGIDGFAGEQQGLPLGNLTDFSTFEDLKKAYLRQVEYQLSMLAKAQDIIYRETGKIAAFPFLSLLYDDCIERNKPLLDGGVRYSSGTLESFGNNSAADALCAIQKLVYDEKKISPEILMQCLDADFKGFEKEYQMLKSVPKYGNDDDGADAMSLWVNEMICHIARNQREQTSLHSFLIVMINNGDSVLFGKACGASADGRKKGQPVTNGNQPGAGNDVQGPTALLNSMSKLSPTLHAGVTNNVKFSRSVMQQHPEKVKALMKGYFKKGGTQVMITSVDRGELEAAMEKPEDYRHLFVRVGGYSERFVDLPKEVQKEVLKRTLYE